MTLSAEEILQRYAVGDRNFAGIELDAVKFKDVDLAGINFEAASLDSAFFLGTNL